MEERYFIEDVLKALKISRKTYYNWEKAGKIPPAKRDPMSKFRYWMKKDIEQLKKITQRK